MDLYIESDLIRSSLQSCLTATAYFKFWGSGEEKKAAEIAYILLAKVGYLNWKWMNNFSTKLNKFGLETNSTHFHNIIDI